MSILEAFKEDNYRVGDLQVIAYDPKNEDRFPSGYIGGIYERLRGEKVVSRREGKLFLRQRTWPILENLFCGMQNLSFDAIVPYLVVRPIAVMGIWKGDIFEEAGIIFPTVYNTSAPLGQRTCMAGYAFFPNFWGKQETDALAILGITFLFMELGVEVIHGMRYRDNDLTAQFLKKFGFRDVGIHPRWMLKRGKLVDGVSSSLLKEDFEACVEKFLIGELQRGKGFDGR